MQQQHYQQQQYQPPNQVPAPDPRRGARNLAIWALILKCVGLVLAVMSFIPLFGFLFACTGAFLAIVGIILLIFVIVELA